MIHIIADAIESWERIARAGLMQDSLSWAIMEMEVCRL